MKLTAENLVYTHPGASAPVLNGVSLEIAPGAIAALLGRNGSGKSTLVRLLSGYLRPDSGTVTLDGRPVSDWSATERVRRLAVVQQHVPLPLTDYTVREAVAMGLTGVSRFAASLTPEQSARLDETLELLDLTPFADRPCRTLSGGERQRVSAATALVRSPGLLLLDEPTSAADPAATIRIMGLLRRLAPEVGVLIVTHDLQLALEYAGYAMLLHEGKIFASGAPDVVLTPEKLAPVYGCAFRRFDCERRPVILPE